MIGAIELMYFPSIVARMISYFTVKNQDHQVVNVAMDKLNDLNDFTRS